MSNEEVGQDWPRKPFQRSVLVMLASLLLPACRALHRCGAEAISDRIRELDGPDQLVAEIHETMEDGVERLFGWVSLEGADPSYEATYELCRLFDPTPDTRDDQDPVVSAAIDRYLELIAEKPVIRYALSVTRSSISDLRNTWFGPTRAFEHVFAGEISADGSVGGYHWWYKFWREEQQGLVDYTRTVEGIDDPRIATICFTWDPDGVAKRFSTHEKSIGGFTVGDSPCALLALGFIALKCGLNRYDWERRPDFKANLNGRQYEWVVVVTEDRANLVSLYPLANDWQSGRESLLPAY